METSPQYPITRIRMTAWVDRDGAIHMRLTQEGWRVDGLGLEWETLEAELREALEKNIIKGNDATS